MVILLDGPVVILNHLTVNHKSMLGTHRFQSVSHTHLLLSAMTYLFDTCGVDPMDNLLEHLSEQTVTEVTLDEDLSDSILFS